MVHGISEEAYEAGDGLVSGLADGVSVLWSDIRTASPVIPAAALANVIQRTSQLVSGAVDVGLYGAERQVERGGDLLVRSAVHVPQHDAGSVLGPEGGD